MDYKINKYIRMISDIRNKLTVTLSVNQALIRVNEYSAIK